MQSLYHTLLFGLASTRVEGLGFIYPPKRMHGSTAYLIDVTSTSHAPLHGQPLTIIDSNSI